MQHYEQTILSQYACSPSLTTLIDAWNQMTDPQALVNRWFDNIWNIETAQGYGLDVWGRIVGVSRVLRVATGTFLGFLEANDLTEEPFNTAPWYQDYAATDNHRLSDSGYRQLIYAKALANITDCSVFSLNKILMMLFAGQGDAWVEESGIMAMRYVFNFTPTPLQISVIQNAGVLPRPAGVTVSYAIREAGDGA
ncbi:MULTISPECIES: DUF2612 domain-containing protein [Acetobacter]|uniref:DUF2612 domain-containing protein n=1 Tax=Acetobacter thailandicus TaxID=1502842 RepID=A0ABT3QC62_9PROT|nr:MULTISPECIES: DUF2612 domain-containing protein [Acetobacter]MBS0961137.1 DUF2612 domain-containing protein [Acetobacter thailandicus]MBS0986872.1 DUF2612 domain-containing protein [Acetobacter thailandicus]MBS1003868.1 DUF2612 domain-containing protein [Acetobacter thailandicus]MCX2562873.1 DUF2612 domain-containing protein [Acetobacter thailandicus]NHN95720.1 DUF2612 domain-containing protein [Acetobacter thailandicus]